MSAVDTCGMCCVCTYVKHIVMCVCVGGWWVVCACVVCGWCGVWCVVCGGGMCLPTIVCELKWNGKLSSYILNSL